MTTAELVQVPEDLRPILIKTAIRNLWSSADAYAHGDADGELADRDAVRAALRRLDAIAGTGDIEPADLLRLARDAAEQELYAVEAGAILKDIIATPISPELLPAAADGSIEQRTEDTVGPYELHDFFLFHLVRHGCGAAKLRFLAAHRDRDAAFLRPESWDTLHTPPFGGDYAMGWVVRPDGLWHNGSITTWYAEMLFDPKRKVSAAAASNLGLVRGVQGAVGQALASAAHAAAGAI